MSKFSKNEEGKYINNEGRFLQVSGLRFKFDPTREPFKRVTEVIVNGHKLDDNMIYKMATTEYLYGGCDGHKFQKLTKIDNEDTFTTFQVVYSSLVNEKELNLKKNTVLKYSQPINLGDCIKSTSIEFYPPIIITDEERITMEIQNN